VWGGVSEEREYETTKTDVIFYLHSNDFMSTLSFTIRGLSIIILLKNAEAKLTAQLHDKRKDFNFSIISLPYLCTKLAKYHDHIHIVSGLIEYARPCST
jgi:hypothetical protein